MYDDEGCDCTRVRIKLSDNSSQSKQTSPLQMFFIYAGVVALATAIYLGRKQNTLSAKPAGLESIALTNNYQEPIKTNRFYNKR